MAVDVHDAAWWHNETIVSGAKTSTGNTFGRMQTPADVTGFLYSSHR
jgi:hypothetical protein